MKHSDAVNRIRLTVSELGGLSVPYAVGMFRTLDSERKVKVGREGVSDVLACIGGKFVAVEVKVDRDRQRGEQVAFQAAVEAAGGLYVLAKFTDAEDGVETLRKALGPPERGEICPKCGDEMTNVTFVEGGASCIFCRDHR